MYLVYLRKSRKDADLEALGIDVLERHEKTLLELARSRGLLIGGIYREVVSGDSIEARPEMQRLLSEVEAGIWDGVLVMEVERLARGDTIDQGRVQRAFFYSNTLIVTPMKTYDPANEYDNEYFEFSLFMSRREYTTIKRRMQRGRDRSAEDGYYVGNIAPYGWKRIKAPDGKHFALAPNEQEAPILRLMYDLVGNKKYGFQKACHELKDMGIVARNGKTFNPGSLRGIIANPANIGKVRWGWRKQQKSVVNGVVVKSRPKSKDYILSDAVWDGQVDEELYKIANTRTSAFTAPSRYDRPLQNPFAGLLYCSECGHVMVRKKATAKTPHDFLICPYAGCKTVAIKSSELEDALFKWLRDYISNYEFIESSDDSFDIASRESVIKNLIDKHDTLIQQRSSLYDLLEQGIYTKDIFLSRSSELEARINQTLEDLESARRDLSNLKAVKENRSQFIPKCQNLLDAWPELDASGKNSALKALLDKIVLTKTKKNTRSHRDSEFKIDVYPKVPR